MIKSLLGEDEEQKDSTPEINIESEKKEESSKEKEVSEDTVAQEIKTQNDIVSKEEVKTEDEIETIEEIKTAIETGNIPPKKNQTITPFEINRPIGQPENINTFEERDTSESANPNQVITKSNRELELEKKLAEIEAELLAEKESQERISEEEKKKAEEAEKLKRQAELEKEVKNSTDLENEKIPELQNSENKAEDAAKVNIASKDFKPESKGETIRKTGLAWSAAIALFGSIVFMMILGWFVDLLLGSTPWGITFGIVLGAIIGFVQFIRITSQIHGNKPNDFEKVSLHSNLQEAKPIIETGTKEDEGSAEKGKIDTENKDEINNLDKEKDEEKTQENDLESQQI